LKDCQDACFIWIEAVAPNLIAGQVKQFAEMAGVESTKIPAYGFGKWKTGSTGLSLAEDDEKIVMHLHGGGFVVSLLVPHS
jgi:acetyl esterase/lipase